MQSKPVKALTLLVFILLVGAFIAFRTGAFNNYFRSPVKNDSAITKSRDSSMIQLQVGDTIIKIDTTRRMMMSGSKSMRLIEPEIQLDTTREIIRTDTFTSVRGK